MTRWWSVQVRRRVHASIAPLGGTTLCRKDYLPLRAIILRATDPDRVTCSGCRVVLANWSTVVVS